MEKLQELWAEKKTRKLVVLGLLALIVVFIGYSMTDDTDAELRRIERMQAQQAQPRQSVFGTSEAATRLGEAEAQDVVAKMAQDVAARERRLHQEQQEMQRDRDAMAARQQEIEQQLFRTQQQLEVLARRENNPQVEQGTTQRRSTTGRAQPEPQVVREPMMDVHGNVINRGQTQIITQNPAMHTGGQTIRTVTQRSIREFRDGKVHERPVEIQTLNARGQQAAVKPNLGQAVDPLGYQEQEGQELFTLSMGSIISGTILNGVAAPTSVERHREPMPVLMRIKREAIMPNYYTLDINDCHMLGSAVGDLSSSRVLIRAESISCITTQGEAIEQSIMAYAVDSSDGMAGIQGDVVFKSGAMIANSLKAEFIRGFSDAFSPRRVQAINTSPGASELWQTQNFDRAAGAGIGQGVSGAASRIADYYMNMAESAFPVIELIPGIEIDFIVQRGMTLRMGGREAPFTGNRMGDRSARSSQQSRTGTNINVSID